MRGLFLFSRCSVKVMMPQIFPTLAELSNCGRTFTIFYQFSHTELLTSKSLVWLNFHLARLGRVKGLQPLTRVAGSSAPRQVEGSCHRGEQLASCWGKAPADPGPGRCMGLDQPLLPPPAAAGPRGLASLNHTGLLSSDNPLTIPVPRIIIIRR